MVNKDGIYLGTDNSATDFVRIIDDETWNKNKKEDGTIDPNVGISNSSLHSEAGISTKASLSIYQRYNPTNLPLKELSYGQFKDANTGMSLKSTNGKVSHIDVELTVSKQQKVSDHFNEIKSFFVHENKHYNDVKEWGMPKYNSTPVNTREQRAIQAQMADPTFLKTRIEFQDAIKAYGKKHGMNF